MPSSDGMNQRRGTHPYRTLYTQLLDPGMPAQPIQMFQFLPAAPAEQVLSLDFRLRFGQ